MKFLFLSLSLLLSLLFHETRCRAKKTAAAEETRPIGPASALEAGPKWVEVVKSSENKLNSNELWECRWGVSGVKN